MIVKGAPIYLCRGLCEGREEELLVMNSFVKLWSNLYVSVQHSGLEWPPAKRCPSRYDVKTAYFHLSITLQQQWQIAAKVQNIDGQRNKLDTGETKLYCLVSLILWESASTFYGVLQHFGKRPPHCQTLCGVSLPIHFFLKSPLLWMRKGKMRKRVPLSEGDFKIKVGIQLSSLSRPSYSHMPIPSLGQILFTYLLSIYTSFGFFYWLLLFSTEWLIIFCPLTSFVSEFKILRWWFSTAVKVLYLVITKEKCGEKSAEGLIGSEKKYWVCGEWCVTT